MTYSMVRPYAISNNSQSSDFVMRLLLVIAAAIGVSAFAPAADARPRDREQDAAWRAKQQGRIMPLPMIEAIIVPRMRGADYLGPEYDGSRYRLKFIREGQVIWIDVDPRTGRVEGRSR